VIIRQEGLDVPVQGVLVENDHMVEALAASRADEAFHVGRSATGTAALAELS
jgi:hypothetical protein